ncbi:MAG: hypothetical protein R3B57_07395 [Phycisphaerales bacterium]
MTRPTPIEAIISVAETIVSLLGVDSEMVYVGLPRTDEGLSLMLGRKVTRHSMQSEREADGAYGVE